jgi:SAM-dependent MidA family methyltransferase
MDALLATWNLPLIPLPVTIRCSTEQFGKAGDYTSSDVHGKIPDATLARQFDQMWQALDRPPEIEILELGRPWSVARDVLDWSNRNSPTSSPGLTFQESSPALRKTRDTLENHLASGKR